MQSSEAALNVRNACCICCGLVRSAASAISSCRFECKGVFFPANEKVNKASHQAVVLVIYQVLQFLVIIAEVH